MCLYYMYIYLQAILSLTILHLVHRYRAPYFRGRGGNALQANQPDGDGEWCTDDIV